MPPWPLVRSSLPLAASLAALIVALPIDALAQSVPWADALEKTSRLVVRFRAPVAATKSATSADREQAASTLSRRALLPLTHVRLGGTGRDHVLSLPHEMDAAQARAVARRLAGDREVESVSLDWRVQPAQAGPSGPIGPTASTLPNDPEAAAQWPIAAPSLGAFGPGSARFVPAWQFATGRNVTVAVIDTGSLAHSDLAGRIVGGYDFVDDPTTASDGSRRDADYTDPGDGCLSGTVGCPLGGRASSWHGTMVAGLIGAIRGNGRAITGAAPDAALLMVRALGRGGGWSSDIADAIRWSAGLPVSGAPPNPRPARVLNLSLGTRSSVSTCEPFMADAVRQARATGAVIVAAAGNEGAASNYAGAMGMPANCDGVIAVAAHNRAGDLAVYSNWSSRVGLTAPGGGCGRTDYACGSGEPTRTLGNTGTLTAGVESTTGFNGTSAAAPHVSAAVALLLETAPTLTPDAVASVLASTATAPPAGTWCASNATRCGAGMLNALEAVRRASGMAAPTVAIEARAREWEPAGGVATLRATATAATGRTVGYQWRQIAGITTTSRSSADGATLSVEVPTQRSDLVFEVTATDDLGQAARAQTSFRSNRPPVIGLPTEHLARPGERLSIPVAVGDDDGDPVNVALLSGPAGVLYDARTSTLSWTPASNATGRFDVELIASDGLTDSSVLARLAIVMSPAAGIVDPSAPVPTARGVPAPASAAASMPVAGATPSPSTSASVPAPASVASETLVIEAITPQTRIEIGVGQSLLLTLTSRDTPAERLSFRLRAGPPGMTIDEATGRVSWSPGGAGGEFGVEIDVVRIVVNASSGSTGVANTSTVAFKVAQAPPASGPAASASPFSAQGGGGAIGPWGIMMLVAAAAVRRRMGPRVARSAGGGRG